MSRFRWAAGCLAVAILAAPSSAQERFRKSPPIPAPLGVLRLPPIESATLSNGLTVAVAQKRGAAMMSLQLVILAGEGDAPRATPGVAAVTADMIGRGTETLSSVEIEDRIEAIGGEFTTDTSIDQTVFSFNVLEENLDRALEILGAIFLQASFTEKALDGVKRTLYYNLLEREKDPEFLAKRQLFRLVFRDHPYAVSMYTEDAAKAVAREDVAAFYDRFYRPNNAILVLAGNINLALAARKVSHYFNTWVEKRLNRPFIPQPAPVDRDVIAFIHQPQAKDMTIFMGNSIFPVASPDYFPFLVLNQILGGTTASRLFMTLRESKGYAYFAFSGMDFYKNCGVFWVRAKVTPEALRDSISEILKLIGMPSIEKITSFEIEQAKSFLLGNFALKNEPLASFSRKISLIRAFNLGEEHWNRYYENIILVNLERVLAAAQKYLQPRPVVVIVGDLDQVAGKLGDLLDKIEFYDTKGQLRSDISKGVEK
jgi:zinc protease